MSKTTRFRRQQDRTLAFTKTPEHVTPIAEKYTRPKSKRPQAPVPKEWPIISEHALVQYMRRVLGMDVDAIRDGILTPAQVEMVKTLGSCKIPLGGGLVAVAKDGRVVTLIEA